MQRRTTPLISFIFLCLTAFAFNARAEIKITSAIVGASNVEGLIVGGDNSGLKILAGFAGTETGGCDPSKTDGNSTCDNCPVGGTTFKACNRTRAYPDLQLKITFQSTSLTSTSSTPQFVPLILAQYSTSNASSARPDQTSIPQFVTAANQDATVIVKWSELCKLTLNDTGTASNDSGCSDVNTVQSFEIGFDSDNNGTLDDSGDDKMTIQIYMSHPTMPDFESPPNTTPTGCANGLCDFKLAPGDQKAVISGVVIKNPEATSLQIVNLLLFCDPGGFSSVTQNVPVAAIPIVSNNLTDQNTLEGFANGTKYYCHGGLQDEAGNIGYFYTGADTNKTFTPDTVVGLFEKKTDCFIATAAYGSPMEKHVQMLRAFRNKYLAPTAVGRAIVNFYYTVSPPLAHWIAGDPNRRAAVRTLLTPMVWSVSVFMNWSWVLGLAVLFGCGLLAFRRKFL